MHWYYKIVQSEYFIYCIKCSDWLFFDYEYKETYSKVLCLSGQFFHCFRNTSLSRKSFLNSIRLTFSTVKFYGYFLLPQFTYFDPKIFFIFFIIIVYLIFYLNDFKYDNITGMSLEISTINTVKLALMVTLD